MSAETNILRHELAEARRKLDAERVNTDNAYVQLAAALRLLERAAPLLVAGESADAAKLSLEIRAHLAANGGKK